MEDLLKVAVAGTGRVGAGRETPGSPIDRAVARIESLSAERELLLTAGAHAVRRRAGVLPVTCAAAPDVSGAEDREVAPQRIVLLLDELLSAGPLFLLPEALDRLAQVPLLIPPALLPAMLDVATRIKALRSPLVVVFGQRGRWLARHNPDWAWATAPGDAELAANAEAIWQEGNQDERLSVLRLVRAQDALRGRALLESTWTKERAAFRAEAIGILRVNLSSDDQPFLEAALSDRATDVRARAEELLVHVPGSGLAAEAEKRADATIGTRPGFHLVVRAPETGDAQDVADAFKRVRPSHWQDRFGKPPSELVKAIGRDRDWGFAVLSGLTQASITFGDQEWGATLWPLWLTSAPPIGKTKSVNARTIGQTINTHLIGLLTAMPPCVAERAISTAPEGAIGPVQLSNLLPHLAQPWSEEFSDFFLKRFRTMAISALSESEVNWPVINGWAAMFQTAALGLSSERFEDASAVLHELLESSPANEVNTHFQSWKRSLQSHIETLHMRQRIHEEIRP